MYFVLKKVLYLLKQINIMRTFLVSYWKETGDDCIDCELLIKANNFDDSYKIFRDMYRLVKIRSIEEYNKL